MAAMDAGGKLCAAHRAITRMRAKASLRACRLGRSMSATSLAGMTYSSLSRQANTTKVANAPTALVCTPLSGTAST